MKIISIRLFLVMAVAILLAGCATVISRKDDTYSSKADKPSRIYSGVILNLSNLSPQGMIISIIDLPFSFVADTILLPVTIYEQFFVEQDFQIAAAKGDIGTVRKMLDSGQDINAKDADGQTALMRATATGRLEVVQLLLEKGAALNEQHKTSKATALIYAVNRAFDESSKRASSETTKNYVDITFLLLQYGADVNVKTKEGQSPLMISTKRNNASIVKAFLDKGVDVNARDNDGRTALFEAVNLDRIGSKIIVQMLLDAGAGVEDKDNDANTILSNAIGKDVDILGMILSRGANPNTATSCGRFPLMIAANYGYNQAAKLLIENGAQVNAIAEGDDVCRGYRGDSALRLAAENGHIDVVQTLINNRADVNARDHDGKTALTLSTKRGHAEIAELLKNAGGTE